MPASTHKDSPPNTGPFSQEKQTPEPKGLKYTLMKSMQRLDLKLRKKQGDSALDRATSLASYQYKAEDTL